jgi:thioesterase domain-containing protein
MNVTIGKTGLGGTATLQSRPNGYALTSSQLAIWIDQALHPGRPIYNTGQTITIKAPVHVDHFRRAIDTVVAESDALRLRFVEENGGVHQIAEELGPTMQFYDLSSTSSPEDSLRAWIDHEFWSPIAAADFPLFKFVLIKLSEDHFVWLQKYHHLVVDATARHLVASRVARIYNALLAEKEIPAAFAASYRVAKDEEDEYLASERYSADEAYWKERLADLSEPIVQVDVSFSERARSGRPTRLACELSASASSALRRFAHEQGASVFKAFLGLTWCCFDHLYGVPDMVFGVPVGNRHQAQTKNLVGLFSKIVPVRIRGRTAPTLGMALAAVERHLKQDLEHQRYPLDDINRALQLRSKGRGALYDVAVNFVRNDYRFDFGGAPITCANLSTGFSVPWAVTMFQFGEDEPLGLAIDYDGGRVDGREAELLLYCFQVLLSGDLLTPQLTVQAALPDIRCRQGAGLRKQADVVRVDYQPSSVNAAEETDGIEKQLLSIWRSKLGNPVIGSCDNFFEVGGTSLKAVGLVSACNEAFRVDLPLSVIAQAPSVAAMAERIRKASGARPRTWFDVVKLTDGADSNPLFLIHPIGGSLLCYRDLVDRLPREQAVFGIAIDVWSEQVPDSVVDLAQAYMHRVVEIVDGRPYHLAGWSFGGIVAFEMARSLEEMSRPTASLVLIDAGFRPPADDEDLGQLLGELGVAACVDPLARSADERYAAMLAGSSLEGFRFRSNNEADHFARYAQIARRLQQARRSYRPLPLRAGMTLIRATHGLCAPDAMAGWWEAFPVQSLSEFSLAGTHYSILRPPLVDQLAKIMSGALARSAVPTKLKAV